MRINDSCSFFCHHCKLVTRHLLKIEKICGSEPFERIVMRIAHLLLNTDSVSWRGLRAKRLARPSKNIPSAEAADGIMSRRSATPRLSFIDTHTLVHDPDTVQPLATSGSKNVHGVPSLPTAGRGFIRDGGGTGTAPSSSSPENVRGPRISPAPPMSMD